MKQFICLFILVCLFTAAKAQTDSLQSKDASKEKPVASAISKEIFLQQYRKQDIPLPNPVYDHPYYRNNYWKYKAPSTIYAPAKNVVGVVGNILLSIIADKTNHSNIH